MIDDKMLIAGISIQAAFDRKYRTVGSRKILRQNVPDIFFGIRRQALVNMVRINDLTRLVMGKLQPYRTAKRSNRQQRKAVEHSTLRIFDEPAGKISKRKNVP